MVKIKICGISRPKDIEAVNLAKPDYVGFVFAKSPRQVSFEQAANFRAGLFGDILVVGVFVNEKIETVCECANAGIIDIIQLHGEEDDEYIKKIKDLTGKQVIKAVSVTSKEDVLACESSCADFVLFDAKAPGSGVVFDWSVLQYSLRPFFLAGGLNIENVQEAIFKTQPLVVDVSSGVERGLGIKDFDKIVEIVRLVRGEQGGN
ncbi:phosphoribosylanthranilate isomerase [Candidatus Gastranaerophilus sp. (ex Termes propinquus)]|nr:phosphoribosylanthranilate isomerase [Candidatus Gastranaerophilus sp. (ex Termes propinquus)]